MHKNWAVVLVGIYNIIVAARSVYAQDLTVYVDREFGFRVEYPRTWQPKDIAGTNLRLLIESPDVDACFFDVSPVPKSKGVEPGKLVSLFLAGDALEQAFRKVMPEARIQSVQKTRFGNQDAVFAIFSNVHEAATLREPQKGVATLTWHNGYSFGGTCLTSPERFPAVVYLFKVVLGSFIFLP